jgi:hypothetical protein
MIIARAFSKDEQDELFVLDFINHQKIACPSFFKTFMNVRLQVRVLKECQLQTVP